MIQKLLKLNENYENNPDKLDYWLFPSSKNNFYNSNSYVAGLRQAADLPLPKIDLDMPGYSKPVPKSYFINPSEKRP